MKPPPVLAPLASTRQATRRRWVLWGGLGMLVLVLVVLHQIPPEGSPLYPRCALHVASGLHCPGCGSTRALHHLTHGQVGEALRANVLLTLAIPLVAVWGGWWVMRRDRALVWLKRRSGWLPVLAVVMVVFGVLRNLPWPPFTWLAP